MSERGFSGRAFRKIERGIGERVGQDLAADETNPPQGRRDASQEEIHHLILNAGWKHLFPDVFSDEPRTASDLFRQWEIAEQKGFYSYWDPTCDSSCKVTEFFYLATAAYLGSQADLYNDEMRIKTRSELRLKLPGTTEIIESPRYVYPIDHWPDGSYRHGKNIVYSNPN